MFYRTVYAGVSSGSIAGRKRLNEGSVSLAGFMEDHFFNLVQTEDRFSWLRIDCMSLNSKALSAAVQL